MSALEVYTLFRGVVIGTRHLVPQGGRPAQFLVGCAPGVDAPAAAELVGASHRLVSVDGSGATVALTEGMTGVIVFEDRRVSLPEFVATHGWSFAPPPYARLEIDCGAVQFLVSETASPAAFPRRIVRPALLGPLAGTALALLAMMALLAFVPPERQALSLTNETIMAHVSPRDFIPKVPPPNPHQPTVGKPDPSDSPARGPRRQVTSRVQPTGVTGIDGSKAGVLPLLSKFFTDHPGLIGSALDEVALQDLRAVDIAAIAAFAPPGTGAPGGGEGRETIGTGDFDIPGVRNDPRFGDRARRASRWDPRRPRQVEVTANSPTVRGTLDKEIIRRVIRRHVNEVRYCYEKELVRKPNLGGRLVVSFAITRAGTTTAAVIASSELRDVAVESCVVDAVRRWEFPHPEGNGLALVSYPFVMTAGQ